uniref:Ubiquitin-like protease family profile domain-containing protein n=1 Tax=Oryza punctata TaxID=4537 RepID=A0A0E0JI25_ORYPU
MLEGESEGGVQISHAGKQIWCSIYSANPKGRNDVVGVLIYVGEIQQLQRYGQSRPTRDIALESEEHGGSKVSILIRSIIGQTYEYLPQDYDLSNGDLIAQLTIDSSIGNYTLVDIGDFFARKNHLTCLLSENEFLNDDIVIHLCLLLIANMIIKQLQGQQNHLNIIGQQQDLTSYKWEDLNVMKWPIIEQLQEKIQGDSSSCGLFMLKIMENWTGDALSSSITQQDITLFRFKLPGILLCWKNNKAIETTGVVQSEDTKDSDDDVVILGSRERKLNSTRDNKETKEVDSGTRDKKYSSLLSVVSTMGKQELISGLLHYIQQINCAEAMEKVWVQSSRPQSISLSLKQLQLVLKKDKPLDHNCFNMSIRKFMYENIQTIHKTEETVANHCLDLKFWVATGFGLSPVNRDDIDLAKLVGSWSKIHYNANRAPCSKLYSGHTRSRTLYVLNPNPLNPAYKNNPNMRYIRKVLAIADHFNKAMWKACPGSRWNEYISLWRPIIVSTLT